MQITCKECNKNIDLPDSKVPEVPTFSVKCPHCGQKSRVDRKPGKSVPPATPRPQSSSTSNPTEPEIYPPEAQVVFIYSKNSSWKTQLEHYFRKKGGFVSSAGDSEGGVRKLQLNRYDTIMLEDSEETVPMQREINSWPGIKRRDVNYLLIGDKARSFDPQEAFVRGVNTYLNQGDMGEAVELIVKCEARFDQRNALWYLMKDKSE